MISKFEELITWQKSRELVTAIYKVTNGKEFSRDFGLRDQIQRAAVSIMSNIAEGFERAGRAEFHQFLVIAKGSCAEVRSQLYVALDIGYISKTEFDSILAMAVETGRIIGGLRASLKKRTEFKVLRTE
jgi:four helix bundle protein